MSEIFLICRGFEFGRYHVPAFEVRANEVVALQLPAGFEAASQLAANLTGLVPRSEIEIRGRCVVAERADPPPDWRRWFSDPTPDRWLTSKCFSPDEAATVLNRHNIDKRHRLSRYPATTRTLLGLEVAFHSNPSVVVFNTSGLDPLGELAVQELVRSNLSRTSAVYLATPFLSQGVRHRRLMPGSVEVEIAVRPSVTV